MFAICALANIKLSTNAYFGVAFSYVTKTRWKQVLLQYKDKWGKTFSSYFAKGRFWTWHQKTVSGSKPPNPQFPLTPFPCFHTYSLSTTLSPSNSMLVKVVQCKFYMTCALTFKRYSPPPNIKISTNSYYHNMNYGRYSQRRLLQF